jgi:hypothetical protein
MSAQFFRRLLVSAAVLALSALSGCVVYPAGPGYGYGYGPGVYVAPPPVVIGGWWGRGWR